MNNDKRTLLFEHRPTPVLPEHRPLYKIGQLLLILHLASRGGKSSLPRIQLFNWALKRHDRKQMLIEASQHGILKVPAWGFDPALAIAMNYALEEKLIESTTTGFSITAKGIDWISEACKDSDCFSLEREFFKVISKSITEIMVTSVSNSWDEA